MNPTNYLIYPPLLDDSAVGSAETTPTIPSPEDTTGVTATKEFPMRFKLPKSMVEFATSTVIVLLSPPASVNTIVFNP